MVEERPVEPGQQELIDRSIAGDARAFEMLVEPMRQKVVRVIATMMSNPDDAADVYQEVLIKMWTRLSTYAGKGGIESWAYAIAMNTAIKRRQQRTNFWRLHREMDDTIAETVADPGAGVMPLDRALGVETSDAIAEALDRLSPKHKAILVLREVEGLSYEEIAATLDINMGTVMSRLHNARKQLKKHMEHLMP